MKLLEELLEERLIKMNTKEIESKWIKYWEENNTFKTDIRDFSKPKYYALDMFPYPSGVGYMLDILRDILQLI